MKGYFSFHFKVRDHGTQRALMTSGSNHIQIDNKRYCRNILTPKKA